jgi:hypothetical protein
LKPGCDDFQLSDDSDDDATAHADPKTSSFYDDYSDALDIELSSSTLSETYDYVNGNHSHSYCPGEALASDEEGNYIDLKPLVHEDYNLLKNFLESHANSVERADPIELLLSQLGVSLPCQKKYEIVNPTNILSRSAVTLTLTELSGTTNKSFKNSFLSVFNLALFP